MDPIIIFPPDPSGDCWYEGGVLRCPKKPSLREVVGIPNEVVISVKQQNVTSVWNSAPEGLEPLKSMRFCS